MGNRLIKENKQTQEKQIYIRDAQGNVMAIYKDRNDSLFLDELHLYGSSRLGVIKENRLLAKYVNIFPPSSPLKINTPNTPYIPAIPKSIGGSITPITPIPLPYNFVHYHFGKKHYELSDWLGNVRVVINDKKTPMGTDSSNMNYAAQVLEVNDYYPFGMLSRNYYVSEYRYGYGNHEKINEVYDFGNMVDMGDRWLDTRLARTPKPDAKAKKYPDISPYAYVGNSPIIFIDADGKEIRIIGTAEFQAKTLAALQKLTNDKLELRNGVLYITKLGVENPDKNFKAGTSLIRELNKKGNGALLYTIVETQDGNMFKPLKEGGTVEFNPDKRTGGHDAETLMGTGKRPPEIGLGHELIHAKHRNQKGYAKFIEDAKAKSNVADPDYFLQTGKEKPLTKEELQTREEENVLRKEQGVPARAITIDDIPSVEINTPKEEKK